MLHEIGDLRAKARRATSVLPLAATVLGAAIIVEGLLVLGLWSLTEPAVGPFVPSDFYWPVAVPVCAALVVYKGRLTAVRVGATYRYARTASVLAVLLCLAAVVPLVALVVDQRVSLLLPGGDPGALPRCVLAGGLLVLALLERRWGTALVAVIVSVLVGGLWITTGTLNVAGTKAELLPLLASVVAAHLVVPGLMLLSSREVVTA